MSAKRTKPIAKAKSAGKTNQVAESLVKCEVKLEKGEWLSPDSCKVFYIDEDANFPDITYEIKTVEPGPYVWSWKISWVVQACPQAAGKRRFKVKHPKTFSKQGTFTSPSKAWKADLGEVIGGDLTVTVKAGAQTFIRKTFIRGKEPGEEKVHAYLDTFTNKDDVALAKKIFRQESKTKHFYSDEMPLTSFDKGYGLGQLTNEPPTYEQVWSWKKHVAEMINRRVPAARNIAKIYLDKHKGYSQEVYDLETLAAYNGIPEKQRYHNWDEKNKLWVVNDHVICDPEKSNTGWNLDRKENIETTLDGLKGDKDSKPFYTGRCYAEHIKNTQN